MMAISIQVTNALRSGHKCDDRGSLAGLSDLFDKLVHGNENPVKAVQTVVALLAGDITS